MDPIGSKTINIQVTDSSLPVPGTPDTGALDVFGGMIDGLSSTPITTILLFALAVAIPMCLIAIIFARLRHNKNSKTAKFSGVLSKITIGLTPVAVALAVMIAPLVNTLAAVEPLNNSAINITIDKAKSLSATGTTTVMLNKDATSHVDIYTSVDNNFNNNLGASLMISANNTNDSSNSVDLSTTNNLIYTTGPVEAGDTTDFNLTVDITKDLPVGEYTGQINFYGDFVQKLIEVTFWCQAFWEGEGGLEDISILDDDILINDIYIGKTVKYEIGKTYTLPDPASLGLSHGGFCYEDYHNDSSSYTGWTGLDRYDEDYYYSPDTYYWEGKDGGRTVKAVPTAEVQSMFIQNPPEPTDEPWYADCWLDWDEGICQQYEDDINQWHLKWERYGDFWQYQQDTGRWNVVWSSPAYRVWRTDWEYFSEDYFNNNGALPLYDGLEFLWEDFG